MELPMLDEREWSEVSPLLSSSIEDIQHYRSRNTASLKQAMSQGIGEKALQRYFELTGFRETNVNALWHHRLSNYGPPCVVCGKPLRTPRAHHCAECGAMRA